MPLSTSTPDLLGKRKLLEAGCFELTHPLGVFPLGNSYFDEAGNRVRNAGLGSLAVLEDELVLEVLGYLDAASEVAACSKALYAFSSHEELWRERCIDKNRLRFLDSWKSTYAGRELTSNFHVRMYSDVLYYPVRCRRAFVNLFERKFEHGNISRVSKAEAVKSPCPGKPFIVTDAVQSWPAWTRWGDRKYFLEKCGEALLACNGALMTLPDFFRYSEGMRGRMEEVGLFVFENKFFGESELVRDFEHEAEIFGEDLFDLLTAPYRPDNKWLLIASQGTFSQWHIDPNSTSAWNAVIQGRKLWLLLPPTCTPCGVLPSSDGTAVKQPRSLYEWFSSGLYAETKKLYGKKLVEGVCGPGEMIFVPRGWWHCVVNLDDTVAVTQNFVQSKHVHTVRRFLKETPQCVSGIENEYRCSLWRVFDDVLKVKRPEFFRDAQQPDTEEHKTQVATQDECGKNKNFSFWAHIMQANTTLDYRK